MKKRILFLLLLVFAIGLINSEVFGTAVKYDRPAGLNYAKLHCSTPTYNLKDYKCFNPRNPNCESTGTDCSNFMSQALIDGGVTFSDCINKGTLYQIKGESAKCDKRELVKGNDVIGNDGSTKGIPVASDLGLVLEGSYCFKRVSSGKAGDIVLWDNGYGCGKHEAMVTDIT